jgi:hypothetical protein
MYTYRLTRTSHRAAGACFFADRVAELVPLEGLSLEEVAALDIPPDDRVWALVSACGAPRDVSVAFARMCEERAVDYHTAAVASAGRTDGFVRRDMSEEEGRAVEAACAATYTTAGHARDAHAYAGVYASVTARSAAKAAASAAAAAAWADVAAGSSGIDVAAVAAAARSAERQWQLDTLVELLSHTHPQIEG